MRLDLAVEWRSRRWRRLLNIIDRLPRNSAYFQALSDDERLAAQFLADPPKEKAPRRRMADWSTEVELLTAIVDRLAEVAQAVAMLGGGKPRKLPRAPQPETAVDRVRERQRKSNHESLVARLLPHKAKTDS